MKQQISISKVKGNPNNPRIIKNDKFKKLVKSIKEFPEMLKLRPIVVDEGMMVLGGNMRLKASKDAGLKEVWIEVAEGLTEEQKKEFIVKDNVGFGEWEWDMLANEWDSVQLAEWGLDVWENQDDKEPEAGLIEDDEIPEVKESKVKRGDIWQLGEHRVMCGDSTSSDDVAKLMDKKEVDVLVTDPPYGMSFKSNHRKVAHKKIENDENIDCLIWTVDYKVKFCSYIFCRWDNLMELKKPKSAITWVKNNWSMGDLKHEHARQSELILFYPKENHYFPKKRPTDIVTHNRTNNELHPTQKPISLLQEIISWTVGVIFDPFLGSGTTLIAAEKLKRKCYGMELDEKYCDVIIERWEQFTGKKAIKNGTK